MPSGVLEPSIKTSKEIGWEKGEHFQNPISAVSLSTLGTNQVSTLKRTSSSSQNPAKNPPTLENNSNEVKKHRLKILTPEIHDFDGINIRNDRVYDRQKNSIGQTCTIRSSPNGSVLNNTVTKMTRWLPKNLPLSQAIGSRNPETTTTCRTPSPPRDLRWHSETLVTVVRPKPEPLM